MLVSVLKIEVEVLDGQVEVAVELVEGVQFANCVGSRKEVPIKGLRCVGNELPVALQHPSILHSLRLLRLCSHVMVFQAH